MAGKTTAFVLLASVLQKLSIVILTIAGARILGSIEYGKFALTYALCINVGAVFVDSFGAAAGIYLVRQKTDEQAAQFAAALVWTACLISLLLAAALFASAGPLSVVVGHPEIESLYRLAALLLLFQVPANVTSASLYALGRGWTIAKWSCAISIVSLLFALIAAHAFGAVGLIAVLSFSAAMSCLIYTLLFPRAIRAALLLTSQVKIGFSRLPVRSFIVPSAAALVLITPVHLICMNMLASSADGLHQTAIFNGCYLICSIFTFVPSALTSLVIPHFSRQRETGRLRQSAFMALGLVGGAGAVLVAAVLVAAPWIIEIFGSDFRDGMSTLRILSGVGLMGALILTTNQLMWTSDRARTNLLGSIIYATTYFVATVVLVLRAKNGADGLAASLLIAQMLQFAMYCVEYARKRERTLPRKTPN